MPVLELTPIQLTALRTVLVSPHTVANAVYWNDKKKADFLAERLKQILALTAPLMRDL